MMMMMYCSYYYDIRNSPNDCIADFTKCSQLRVAIQFNVVQAKQQSCEKSIVRMA